MKRTVFDMYVFFFNSLCKYNVHVKYATYSDKTLCHYDGDDCNISEIEYNIYKVYYRKILILYSKYKPKE